MKVETQTHFKVISIITSLVLVLYIGSQWFQPQDDFKDVLARIERFDSHELSRLQEAMGLQGSMDLNQLKSYDETPKDPQVSKREDKKDDKKDKDKENKPFKPLDNAGIRFAIAFGGILVINFVAIFVHHIYMKLSSSQKSYRTIEHNLSPF